MSFSAVIQHNCRSTSVRATRALLTATVLSAALCAGAEPTAPQPVLPDSFKWSGPPNNPLLKGAWVIGAEKESGHYALRVTLMKGGKIPAHTHPDTRRSTVLSGTLYVGFGEVDDESKMVAVPAGAVYSAPANVPHYLYAKDGDVIYQENGTGPTATVWVTR
jgi:quercetin dioxygenase-like cupin family protein